MAAYTEQQARDRLLAAFIDTAPLLISLERPVYTTTAAGGRVQSGTIVVDPQKFYFYPFKRRLTQEYVFNPQTFGEDKVIKINYILAFNHNADIQEGDFFDVTGSDRLEDGHYTVEFVSARRWDRGQAGILFRGL